MSQDDSDKRLLDWYDSLTGRRPDADPEARALREALLLEEREAPVENLDQDWHRLRFRLRREGLLEEEAPRRPWLNWALAASVLMAGGLGVLLTRETPAPHSDDAPVMRGAPAQAIVLRVPDPTAAAEHIARVCREAGMSCQRRQDAGGASLLDIPTPAPPALSDTLKEYGAELPPDKPVTLVLLKRP